MSCRILHVNLEDVERRRSSLIFAVCLVCVCVATGCKENSQSPITEKRAPQNERSTTIPPGPFLRPDSPVIVTFGDSLTAGVAGRSYPDQLQDLLSQHGYKYRVENQGVSGDTTTDGLARIENAIASKPAVIVLEFGGNDGLRGTPVDSIRKNLDAMVSRIQSAKIPLVLLGITLPPNYGPEYVKPFAAIFPDVAKKHKIPVLPFLLLNVYQHPELMQSDGIHPNGEGNKIVAQDVFKLIAPMLKQADEK